MALFRGIIFRHALAVRAALATLVVLGGVVLAQRGGLFEDDFDRMVAPVVMIGTASMKGDMSIGSGTIIASIPKDGKYDTYVLTAYHIVKVAKKEDGTWLPIKIRWFIYRDNKRVGINEPFVEVAKASPNDDLALLKFTLDEPFRHVARLGKDPVAPDRVYAVGFQLGRNPLITEGIVSGTQGMTGEPRIYSSAPAMPGSSGGALYDISQKLVGVPVAVAEYPMETPLGWLGIPVPHMQLAIPISAVRTFIEDTPVNGKTR